MPSSDSSCPWRSWIVSALALVVASVPRANAWAITELKDLKATPEGPKEHEAEAIGAFSGLYPRKSISCRLGPRAMRLVLAGLTKEAGDDEKEIGSPYLFASRTSSSEPGEAKGPASPVFAAGGPQTSLSFLKKSGSNHYCDDTVAFHAGRGLLGLAFQVDDRPNPEQLGVVFFDLRTNKVVDVADRLGAFSGLSVARGDLEYRSLLSRTESSAGVETTIKDKVLVLEEDELRPWYRVTLSGVTPAGASPTSRLVRQADRERTWQESIYRPFFKTREAFEAAFGFDADRVEYSKPWVYVARVKDRVDESCILPASERMPKFKADSPWICSKKSSDRL